MLFSNESKVTWTQGKHSTFLTLNLSPDSGNLNKPLTLAASLADISASPAAPVAGATLNFSFAGQTCTATTNAAGTAGCSVTPNVTPGAYTLEAAFAGTDQLLPDSARKSVTLAETPPAPTTTVQFDAASYDVSEGCTSLTVTVTRTGEVAGASTVDYATLDAAATERKD